MNIRNQNRTETGRVALVVGGACQSLSSCVPATAADVVLAVDVARELDGVNFLDPRVLPVPLAVGETLKTLANDDCHRRLLQLIRERPAIDLVTGCGQVRLIGATVGQRLVGHSDFPRLLGQILDRLLIAHNGQLDRVEIQIFGSGSGGTCGGLGAILAREFSDFLLRHSSATVTVEFVVIGAASFQGLGERIPWNNAASLHENLQYVCDPDYHPFEVRRIKLTEMPMVQGRRTERDRYVATFVQALESSAVRSILDLPDANRALDSETGQITILRAGWFHELTHAQVAADVAARMLPLLDQVEDTDPRASVVDDVQVLVSETPMAGTFTVQELVGRVRASRRREPEGLYGNCLAPTVQYRDAVVYVKLSGEQTVNLTAAFRAFCDWADGGFSAFCQKLTTLRAIGVSLDQQLAERLSRVSGLQRAVKAAEIRISGCWRRLYPKTFVEHLVSKLVDPNETLDRLANALVERRAALTRLHKTEAEVEAIRAAAVDVRRELASEKRRLRVAGDLLACARTSRSQTEPYVEAGRIEDGLGAVLELALRTAPDSSEFRRLLAGYAERVTLAGLAAIAGTAERRIEAIAHCFLQTPPTMGPPWGGQAPTSAAEILLVVPPLAERLRDELRQKVERVGHAAQHPVAVQLVCADTLAAGVTAVRLEVYKPRRFEGEVVTRAIRGALEVAKRDPDLYFVRGNGRHHGPLAAEVEEMGNTDRAGLAAAARSRSLPR